MVDSVTVLNTVTRKLPFLVSVGDGEAEAPREEVRLRHRVLDLRCVAALELRIDQGNLKIKAQSNYTPIPWELVMYGTRITGLTQT